MEGSSRINRHFEKRRDRQKLDASLILIRIIVMAVVLAPLYVPILIFIPEALPHGMVGMFLGWNYKAIKRGWIQLCGWLDRTLPQ
jgi:hypothetical protein